MIATWWEDQNVITCPSELNDWLRCSSKAYIHLKIPYLTLPSSISSRSSCVISLTLRRRRSALDPSPLTLGVRRSAPCRPRSLSLLLALTVGALLSRYTISTASRLASASADCRSAGPSCTDLAINPANIGDTLGSPTTAAAAVQL